jgi:hypothetical protein
MSFAVQFHMLAVIAADGTTTAGRGISASANTAPGEYTLTPDEGFSADESCVLALTQDGTRTISANISAGSVLVTTKNSTTGANTNAAFSLAVVKIPGLGI